MPIDSALVLRAEADINTTTTTTAIDVEGGSDADLVIQFQTPTGTSPTMNVDFQVRVDGSTYVTYMSTRQFTSSDTTPTDNTYFRIQRPVYIPPNTQTDAYTGSLFRTQCRLVITIGGSATPTFVKMSAFLDLDPEGRNPARARL